uniref:WW domain-containing protein n=1 Tax=Tetraselmis sp. GSL018 TaxID=582737 RepID=A0A061R0D3_9CHLO|mmetsp:Transcript_20551/g.48944  ORF Transcript_20551/g.48944 Transcript_20551/m.48944 type:complete len:135 (+) Transcript_20551:207-611(+)
MYLGGYRICRLLSLLLVSVVSFCFVSAEYKSAGDARGSDYIYWNEVTGATQEFNPGGIPFEDKSGNKYWMTGLKAELLDSDPEEAEYVWVKKHSEESGRDYYVNQETGESTWERPVDLAWRLVKRPVDDPYAEI